MKKDMTPGSEWRVMLFSALPVIGFRLFQALCNTTDALTAASVAGPPALGAISLT
ncbi:MAG: hypothetical protein LBL73_11540 [Synergistaceae bacterium]|nr:hypothetical protein [Synergistaceae bacterium]